MKKSKATLMVTIMMACIILAFFTACFKTTSDPTSAVCILYGNSRNVPLPSTKVLTEEVAQMAETTAYCSVIVIDGSADATSYTSTIRKPDSVIPFIDTGNNEKYINQVVSDICNDCVPNASEVDVIGALQNAKKALAKENVENKKIVIFSSGISTEGALDFASNPNLIFEEPEAIVNNLKASGSLPDLEGVTIVWHGFGIVEKPQQELSQALEKRLINIWNAILKAADVANPDDAIKLDIGTEQNSDKIAEKKRDYPLVSSAVFEYIIELDEEKVEFLPDSEEFVDEEKVYTELQPYVKLMLESDYKKFYVIGSTASDGDDAGCMDLSVKRAEIVKNVLVGFGVPESYLDTYGIGREILSGKYIWRVNDLNPDGTLNAELAPLNRKVTIVVADSDYGKEFEEIWISKDKQ